MPSVGGLLADAAPAVATSGQSTAVPRSLTIAATVKRTHPQYWDETMREHWRLPVAASALLHSPAFVVLPRRESELRLLFEGDDGVATSIALHFSGVESYKCTFVTSCTAAMFSLAYGKLVSLNSQWLEEVRSSGKKDQATIEALQHLMITFDDGPCYEIICRSWSIVK